VYPKSHFCLNNFYQLFLVVLVGVLLGACNRGGLPCVEQNKVTRETNESTNLAVHVGVDGSQSMLGFAKGNSSRYITVIQKLDDLLRPNNLKANFSSVLPIEDVKVNYFRLGVKEKPPRVDIQRIQGTGQTTSFLDAKFSRFYDGEDEGRYPSVSSSLHQLLDDETLSTFLGEKQQPKTDREEQAGQDVMRIMISDLEPDNSAIGEITARISRLFTNNPDYKAILLGIRSEFNGTVFSTDRPDENRISYQSSGNPDETGRPFYLFILGPDLLVDSFVKRFFDRLGEIGFSAKLSSFQYNDQTVTLNIRNDNFGEKQSDCTQRESRLKGKRPKNDQESQWLILSQERCGRDGSDGYKEFQLKDVISSSSLFLRGVTFDPSDFKVSEQFIKINEVSTKDIRSTPYLNFSIQFTGEEANSDTQSVFVTLKKDALDDLVWKDWDTSINNLIGTRTQQLLDFVRSLRDRVSVDNRKQGNQTQDAIQLCLGYVRK
jgi:hypothetical protein